MQKIHLLAAALVGALAATSVAQEITPDDFTIGTEFAITLPGVEPGRRPRVRLFPAAVTGMKTAPFIALRSRWDGGTLRADLRNVSRRQLALLREAAEFDVHIRPALGRDEIMLPSAVIFKGSEVLGVSPKVVQPGDTVTIVGNYLGDRPGQIKVAGRIVPKRKIVWGQNEIMFPLPNRIGGGNQPILILLRGNVGFQVASVNVDAPVRVPRGRDFLRLDGYDGRRRIRLRQASRLIPVVALPLNETTTRHQITALVSGRRNIMTLNFDYDPDNESVPICRSQTPGPPFLGGDASVLRYQEDLRGPPRELILWESLSNSTRWKCVMNGVTNKGKIHGWFGGWIGDDLSGRIFMLGFYKLAAIDQTRAPLFPEAEPNFADR